MKSSFLILCALSLCLGNCTRKKSLRHDSRVTASEDEASLAAQSVSHTKDAGTEETADEPAGTAQTETGTHATTTDVTDKDNVDGPAAYDLAIAAIDHNDWEKAKEWYLVACQKGYRLGCHRYGWQLYKDKNFAGAAQFFKQACSRGYGKSCSNLAHWAAKNNDQTGAAQFFREACDKGHKPACAHTRPE